PQWILHPPKSRDGEYTKIFKEHLAGKQGQTLEDQIVTKTGQIRDVAIKASLIEVQGKRLMQGIFRDITENKKTEAVKSQLLEQLASANQDLKDFAYVVSHDLKAPLRGIKTIADWITTDYTDKLDNDGKEQLALLAKRVDRMHNLIDGVLQYSRIGRVEEKKVAVNLNELVAEAIDMVASPKNIAVTIENALPTIECDPTRIMQVFQNLLSNAVKYMDKPQGRIKVGCVEEDGFWKFSVTDNGPGIEEKYFEKIFLLFQTLSPRDESESTGVGLTVIKKIVELYKGKIWVQSKVGEGSTFFFTFPKQGTVVKDAKLEAVVDCK
ncbi:MAG: ATP-binding protein, partial [Phycisphaerae bacterium]